MKFTRKIFTKFLFLFCTINTTSPTSFTIVYVGKCYRMIQIIDFSPFLVNFIIRTPAEAMHFLFKTIFSNCANFICIGLSQSFFRQKNKLMEVLPYMNLSTIRQSNNVFENQSFTFVQKFSSVSKDLLNILSASNLVSFILLLKLSAIITIQKIKKNIYLQNGLTQRLFFT